MKIKDPERRQFIKKVSLAGLGLPFSGCCLSGAVSRQQKLFTQFGINANFTKAGEVKAAGADFLLMSVGGLLMPGRPEADFEKQLALLERSPLPVHSCNSFLRGRALRSIGPDAKTDHVLRFAETAFKRAGRAGVKRIIFGSSGSRMRPAGWSKARVDEQFIKLLKKMGPMAGGEGVKVVVENLNTAECNYLTRVGEVGELVEAVDHPAVRMLGDLYHSSLMGDPPEDYARYAHLMEVVDIAEKEGRTPPGVSGQDFRSYFRALKGAGFHGPIQIEAKWELAQLHHAFATLREQASQA